MPDSYHDIEARIMHAVDALKQEEFTTIKAAAQAFNVPYSRLYARVEGRKNRSERRATNRRLSEAQELALCRYIDELDKHDIPATQKMVHKTANSILKEGHTDQTTSPPKVGEKWPKRFFQRHPEYRRRRQHVIDAE